MRRIVRRPVRVDLERTATLRRSVLPHSMADQALEALQAHAAANFKTIRESNPRPLRF